MSGPTAPPRLRVENYPQVRAGLTQDEVEELLGGPPGNYGLYAHGGLTFGSVEYFIQPPGSVRRVWCDDSTWFEIDFDAGGRVVGRHKRAHYEQFPSDGTLTEFWRHSRRRLGL